MEKMEIPYNVFELRAAIVTLNNMTNEESDRIGEKFGEKFKGLSNKKQLNKMIADDNGITILELINSQNYKILKDEFLRDFPYKAVEWFVSEGLTDIQGWLIIASSLGLVDGLH